MKKFIVLLILPFVLLTSCSKPINTEKNKPDSTKIESHVTDKNISHSVKDYYPFKENIKMKYKGTGNEFAEKTVYTDYIKGDRIQLRIVNPGTTSAQILENKDGELRLITSKGEFYYRDDITDSKNDKYEILLKEPLAKGTSWTLANGSKRYISDVDKEIETPAGKFKALEVTTESAESKTLDYYVLNMGLVKTVFKSKDAEVITTLENVEENAPVHQTVKFYYPDYVEDKIIFVKRQLDFKTNDDLKNLLENNFKEVPNKDISHIFSKNVKINKVYLDDKSNTVKIDISDNFVKEMNAGGGLESAILKCITNTLGDYYNVDKVSITLNGKPYASGHIILNENETLKVDYNGISEYK
ncbi:Sporulation and spore germination [Clostridium liquoris]|jgi:hypothetical protein|uniref:Sporulation and spore germination n=1 Tax=Clostridium liquoris TaxID=1289519 RepID=A0A2T0B2I1_9CLOT|nr:GerMN domain-containing protein [Clostridium liquoris]PRR78104.1 Sporulation and spore germination [Clostridium liquoris]